MAGGAFLTPEQLAMMQAGVDPEMGLQGVVRPDMPEMQPQGAFSMGDPSTMSTADILAGMPQPSPPMPKIPSYPGRGMIMGQRLQGNNPVADQGNVAMGQTFSGLAELSGVPSIMRGGENIYEGAQEGSPLQMAAGAGEAALGAMPFGAMTRAGAKALGSAFSTMPRSVGAMTALTAPGAFLESNQALAAKTQQQVSAELMGMNPEQVKAYQRMIGVTPDGRAGPETVTAAVEYDRRQGEKAAAEAKAKQDGDNAVALAKAQGEADATRDAARMEAETKAIEARERSKQQLATERKATEATKPLRELYPELMPGFLASSIVGGTALGSFIKSRYGKAFNSEITDLKTRTQTAIKAKNYDQAKALDDMSVARQKKGPGGTLPAMMAGGALGGEIALIPDEIDAYRGVAGMKDVPAALGRGGIGALLGALPALGGAEVMGAKQLKSRHTLRPEIDHPPNSVRGQSKPQPAQSTPVSPAPASGTSVRQAPGSGPNAGAPATVPVAASPSVPAVVSPQSPSVAPADPAEYLKRHSRTRPLGLNKPDNTALVTPTQTEKRVFEPGVKQDPRSGMRVYEMAKDEKVRELAMGVANAKTNKVMGSKLHEAMQKAGMDASEAQARGVAARFTAELRAATNKANRGLTNRGAKNAMKRPEGE